MFKQMNPDMGLMTAGNVQTDILEDDVGVQVDADHVRGGVVQVKVAGVDAHNKGHRCQQHVGHLQRTQWDVGAEPAQGEAHLARRQGHRHTEPVQGQPTARLCPPDPPRVKPPRFSCYRVQLVRGGLTLVPP